MQVRGLYGEQGIVPIAATLASVREALEGTDRFLKVPTLFWISASDGMLVGFCAAGLLLSLAVIAGFRNFSSLSLLWLLYLSFNTVGDPFLPFQWDALLLEAGFAALLVAPISLRPSRARSAPVSVVAFLPLRWLLFRLYFSSGVVKVRADEVWRDLTALTYHYETQPLPPFTAWTVHHLPVWFHQASCFLLLAIELAVPFLLFLPGKGILGRIRLSAVATLAGLQVLILLTGNYTFFNWLTLVLCVPFLADRHLPRWWRRGEPGPVATSHARSRRIRAAGAVILIVLSIPPFLGTLRLDVAWPRAVRELVQVSRSFLLTSTYGLFANMTEERPEVTLEGSMDGKTWKEVAFRYKPGDPARAPAFVAPHQPRLDWQMWFLALGSPRERGWFLLLCQRILQGSPPVLGLLGEPPFPDGPPRYLRARLDDYRFTTREEARESGHWWRVERGGLLIPVITLDRKGNLVRWD